MSKEVADSPVEIKKVKKRQVSDRRNALFISLEVLNMILYKLLQSSHAR